VHSIDSSQQFHLAQQPSNDAPLSSVDRVNEIDYWLGSLIIVMPLALTIAFVARRRHRTASRQRQIALLEKIWKVDTHERSS